MVDIPTSAGELESLQNQTGEMGILWTNSSRHIEVISHDEINNALEIHFSPLIAKEIQIFNSDKGVDFLLRQNNVDKTCMFGMLEQLWPR